MHANTADMYREKLIITCQNAFLCRFSWRHGTHIDAEKAASAAAAAVYSFNGRCGTRELAHTNACMHTSGSHGTRIILIMIIMNAELVLDVHTASSIMMQSRSKLINYEIINRFCCNNNNPTFISHSYIYFVGLQKLAGRLAERQHVRLPTSCSLLRL